LLQVKITSKSMAKLNFDKIIKLIDYEFLLAIFTECDTGSTIVLGNMDMGKMGNCDWLKNFDVHKEARAGEVNALKKAKAVLSGADFAC